jgi:hypothetical protein
MHTRKLLIAPGLGLGLAALLIQGLALASRNTVTPLPVNHHISPAQAIISVALSSSKDNTLYEDAGGALSNGAGQYFFVGRTTQGANSIRRGLIAFDIAGTIPPGSIIVSATLRLNMSRTSAVPEPVELHPLTASWGEGTSNAPGGGGSGTAATSGDATWIHRFYASTLWTTPGGDFVVTASATTTVGSVGFYTWDTTTNMVADVQTWLAAPAANFGWLLLGNETTTTTAKRFNTREHSDPTTRPALMVEYVPPYAIYLPILLKN